MQGLSPGFCAPDRIQSKFLQDPQYNVRIFLGKIRPMQPNHIVQDIQVRELDRNPRNELRSAPLLSGNGKRNVRRQAPCCLAPGNARKKTLRPYALDQRLDGTSLTDLKSKLVRSMTIVRSTNAISCNVNTHDGSRADSRTERVSHRRSSSANGHFPFVRLRSRMRR